MIGTILTLAGLGIEALGQLRAGRQAKRAGEANAQSIEEVARQNADLILQGADLNAGVDIFNAGIYDASAVDAVTRGQETENRFRTQLKGLIGSQRVSYAAQGVDVAEGSPLEVQMDTAHQGELDALTIRTNAAREAWGYSVQAQGSRLQAERTRKLGLLQSRNVRDVARAEARNARMGGNYAASAANWGVASTIATGAGNLYLRNKYGVS